MSCRVSTPSVIRAVPFPISQRGTKGDFPSREFPLNAESRSGI